MPSRKKLLLTIPSYAYLEDRFLAAGDFDRGTVIRKSFPDGERYLRLADDCWGRNVVVLGGTPRESDWLEIFDLGCALARAGARSMSLVMPYFGYSTMERAVLPGEVVTAQSRALLISAIPPCEAGNRVFLFDLHTDGIEFYFGDSHVTRHLYGAPVITGAIRALMGDRPYLLGATDAGRAKWVQSLARTLGVEPAFVYKKRESDSGKLSVTGVNADVRGREVVIYDDMIRTGGTLLQAGRAYLGAGATRVHAIATHLVLPGDSLDVIRKAGVFATIGGTDSHPGSQALAGEPGAIGSVVELLAQEVART